MEVEKEEQFDVRMLGHFSVKYGGKEISLGRSSTLKSVQMLQLVWLYGDQGISKGQLGKALYDQNDISNLNNSINNLLYQLRRKMVQAGLPKGEYIVASAGKGGGYTLDPRFPVRLDVTEFKKHMEAAASQADEQKACQSYEAAFELYRGDLLPAICTELWVILENKALKESFDLCVRWLGDYYKRTANYASREYLYERASKLFPFDNWQIGQIEVLVDRGDYKQAYLLYNDMVRRYSEDMGLPPTPEMLRCYERISQTHAHIPGEIEGVKKGIWECVQPANVDENNAYFCTYRSFADICHTFSRTMERTGRPVYLMLCTLVDYEGKQVQNQEKLKSRSVILKDVIGKCLRKGDVYTRYTNAQFLILLTGVDEEDCELIYRRISRRLKEQAGSRAELDYTVSLLSELRPLPPAE